MSTSTGEFSNPSKCSIFHPMWFIKSFVWKLWFESGFHVFHLLLSIFPTSHVMLPKDLARLVPKSHLMTESEWRAIGVQQSRGKLYDGASYTDIQTKTPLQDGCTSPSMIQNHTSCCSDGKFAESFLFTWANPNISLAAASRRPKSNFATAQLFLAIHNHHEPAVRLLGHQAALLLISNIAWFFVLRGAAFSIPLGALM